MRNLLLIIFILPFSLHSQDASKKDLKFDPNIQVIEAKASCGICMFDMDGFKCELAVNINGAKYYVEGTDIDDYGDAHSDDGFCNAIRDAKINLEQIDGVAATAGPGLIVCLTVGLNVGKAIAGFANKPFVAVNHLEGHALSPALNNKIEFPYLLLLISVLLMKI